jgi:hypothetical protein
VGNGNVSHRAFSLAEVTYAVGGDIGYQIQESAKQARFRVRANQKRSLAWLARGNGPAWPTPGSGSRYLRLQRRSLQPATRRRASMTSV